MPQINVGKNLDDVSGGFDPVAAGRYTVKVESPPELKPGKVASYLNWQLTIRDNPDEDMNGRILWEITSLAENSLWRLKELLKALGVPWTAEGFNTEDTLGTMCQVVVTLDAREDKPDEKTNNIKSFIPMEG